MRTKKEKKRRNKKPKTVISLDEVLQQVRDRGEPNVNGSDVLGIVQVVDPESSEGEVRAKVVNLRDDPVGQMAKRGQLGNDVECAARLKAARRWQTLYETAEIGGARAIDPGKEYVDGGRFATPDTDKRLAAQAELNHLKRVLGANGDRLVMWVLGLKFCIGEVARILGRKTRLEKLILGARFRECLDTVAVELGIALGAAAVRGPKRKRDEYDILARYADNPQLHQAVRRAMA